MTFDAWPGRWSSALVPLTPHIAPWLLCVGLVACQGEARVGNAQKGRSQRNVKPFYELEIEGAFRLSIAGGKTAHRVTLEGDSNLLPLITTESNGKRLRISQQGKLRPQLPLAVHLDVPDIKLVRTRGALHVEVRQIDNARFQLDCQGACSAKLHGKTQKLWIYLKGGGNVDALKLPTLQGLVSIQGAGTAKVDVTDNLELLVRGAGLVRYRGNPKIERHLRGAGRLEHLGPSAFAGSAPSGSTPASTASATERPTPP